MATNFPGTGLDSYNALVDNTDDILASHVNDRGDAIEALEAKVGINGSAVTTSHDYKLSRVTGADKAAAFSETLSIVDTSHNYKIQFGSVTLTFSNAQTVNNSVTFGTAFGTALTVVMTNVSATTTNPTSKYVTSSYTHAASGFNVEGTYISGNSTDSVTVDWIAIGY